MGSGLTTMDCKSVDFYGEIHAWEIRRYTKPEPGGELFLYDYPIVAGLPTEVTWKQTWGVAFDQLCDCRVLAWNATIDQFPMIVPQQDWLQDARPLVKLALAPGRPLPPYVIPAKVAEYRRVTQAINSMNKGTDGRLLELEALRAKIAKEIDERLANQILFGVPSSPKPQNTVKLEIIRKGKLHDTGK